MSARPQADWHEMEPLYSLSPQHDTTRPLDPPPRPAKSALTLYAPEMREPGGIRIGKPGWESTIGARWTPPLPPQMSEEAIKVQRWLAPPSKRVRPSVMLPAEWAMVVIGIVTLIGLCARWLR